MKIQRIFLHSFALAALNLGSIIFGFGVYHFFKPVNQIAVQVPAAAACCIFAFLAWSLLIEDSSFSKWSLTGIRELLWVYAASLMWAPIVFVPVHYVTQGYLTSLDNITASWLFQLPVNFLAVLAVFTVNKLTPPANETA